jgi:plastocyanin
MKTSWIVTVAVVIIIAMTAYFVTKQKETAKTDTNKTAQEQVTPVDDEGSTVMMADLAFNPSEIRIKKGSEVTFTNNDTVAHTVTADDGSFDSGELPVGESFRQLFEQAGTFQYHCTIHPQMIGAVIVE